MSGPRAPEARKANTAMTPVGRFRKKIARQVTVEVSTPPATGPITIAIAPPIVHRAIALARAAGSSYAWRTRASEAGMVSAAALP